MAYFKMSKNNKVVSVGSVYLRWDIGRNRLFICEADDAQFVQAFDESNIYHDTWMKSIPKKAKVSYEIAKVIEISESEYEDLKAILSEGEVIELPEVIEEQPEETPEIQEEEKPMTIAEMREMILNQQKQIDLLLQNM